MLSALASSQASPTCAGVAPRRLATLRTAGSSTTLGIRLNAEPSGKYRDECDPGALQWSSTPPSSWLSRL
jgi:hypothetical protein